MRESNSGGMDPLSLFGVKTDRIGRVTELVLIGQGLKGSIPPELGNLTNLSELDLRRNRLTGSIPPELGNLANLSVLRLSDTYIESHSIPQRLSRFVSCVLTNNDAGLLVCSQ